MDACIQYFGLTPGLNVSDASAYCQTFGGQLLVIEQQAKFNFMTTLYQTDYAAKGKNPAAWVSLARILDFQFYELPVIPF